MNSIAPVRQNGISAVPSTDSDWERKRVPAGFAWLLYQPMTWWSLEASKRDSMPSLPMTAGDVAPELLMQACERLGPESKFDSIVVDEGQDFHDLWWTSLDSVFRDPGAKGCYYVFFDPNQNLYVDSPAIPGELGPAFELPVNCRNTVRIAEHCAGLVNQLNKVRDGAPIGDAPEFVRAKNMRNAFQQTGKRVREWCMPNAGGLKLHQVAVLAPGNTERDWPADFQTVPLTKDFDAWRKGKGVLIASWARFKGLEADAIVIVEMLAPDNGQERANRYVARSRAKHLLTVIQVEK